MIIEKLEKISFWIKKSRDYYSSYNKISQETMGYIGNSQVYKNIRIPL